MCDTTSAPAADTTASTPTPTPTLRPICCVAAPRRRAPTLADQLRAAAVWAQIFQRTETTPAQEEADDAQ